MAFSEIYAPVIDAACRMQQHGAVDPPEIEKYRQQLSVTPHSDFVSQLNTQEISSQSCLRKLTCPLHDEWWARAPANKELF